MRRKSGTSKVNVDGRIWLNAGNKSFLGQGKIELIEKIKQYGSLRKAAAAMKISYQQAWYSINGVNKIAGKPLVILKRGGKDGGIAEVTETGEKVIFIFKQLHADFDLFLQEKSITLEI